MHEDIGTKAVLIRMKPFTHKKLTQMTLDRSAEIGRRVSMAYVIDEMIEMIDQTGNPKVRSAEIFGSNE